MTSRERIEAAFNHEAPDQTPVFEYVLLSPIADRILGRKYAGDPANWKQIVEARGWDSAVKRIATDRLALAEILGHDMMYVPPNPLPPDVPPWQEPAEIGPIDDPVEKVRKRTILAKSIPPIVPEDTLLVYRYLKREMVLRGIDLPVLAPVYKHGVWNDTDLMQTMLLEPEVAHDHFAVCTRNALRTIETFLECGIEMIGIGGDFAGNRPLISPESYQRFIAPELQILSDRIHAFGRLAINASDGNLWPVIDDFLISTRVDGYIEIDLHAGMDLSRLKAEYGDRITFLGNLDCGNVLSFGTIDEVKQHVKECLDAGLGSGGHILTHGNAITSSVPLPNYLAAVNTYREYWDLPAISISETAPAS